MLLTHQALMTEGAKPRDLGWGLSRLINSEAQWRNTNSPDHQLPQMLRCDWSKGTVMIQSR